MSLVKYEGPMDPIQVPFDTRRQAVYLHHLSIDGLRSKAAKAAGVRLAQVNSLRNRDSTFRELEAASLEEAAEDMLDATKTLAEQGDVKAFQIMMNGYYMPGNFGNGQQAGTVNNTQINILESGERGIREELEHLRQAIRQRAAELEPPAS